MTTVQVFRCLTAEEVTNYLMISLTCYVTNYLSGPELKQSVSTSPLQKPGFSLSVVLVGLNGGQSATEAGFHCPFSCHSTNCTGCYQQLVQWVHSRLQYEGTLSHPLLKLKRNKTDQLFAN